MSLLSSAFPVFPAGPSAPKGLGPRENHGAGTNLRWQESRSTEAPVPSQTASDSRSRPVTSVQPFQIRGRFLTAVALRVDQLPDPAFYAALDQQLAQTPQFFAGAPLVLDLERAPQFTDGSLFAGLIEELRRRNLGIFAVQNAAPAQLALAAASGLIEVSGGRDTPLREQPRPKASEPAPAPRTEVRSAPPERREAPAALQPEAPAPKNLLITRPIRSGQTVVAEHGDLTIIGPVSSGAELIASGNIHIYGSMRGRAMAGAHGDTSARIFCQSLHAELLAIAGLYRTSDNMGDAALGTQVQVFLRDEQLQIEPLG